MGNVSRCCLALLLLIFFMSKLSVADLRGILSRIFEHQCHKDQTGQQVFLSKSQKYYTTTYFISQGINYHRGGVLCGARVSTDLCHLRFCFVRIFCQISKLYTLSGVNMEIQIQFDHMLTGRSEFKNRILFGVPIIYTNILLRLESGQLVSKPDFIKIKLSKLIQCRLRKPLSGAGIRLVLLSSNLSSLSKYRQVIYFQSVDD